MPFRPASRHADEEFDAMRISRSLHATCARIGTIPIRRSGSSSAMRYQSGKWRDARTIVPGEVLDLLNDIVDRDAPVLANRHCVAARLLSRL